MLITFDDGPDLVKTPIILDILKQFGIQAVFFLSAERCSGMKELAIMRRMRDDGHIIGSHGYGHIHMALAKREVINDELKRATEVLEDYLGPWRLFRPPYGDVAQDIRDAAAALKLNLMFWNVDPEDWKGDANSWIERALSQGRHLNEALLLLHDTHTTTHANLAAFLTAAINIFSFPPFFGFPECTSPWQNNWQLGPGVCEVWRPASKARGLYLHQTYGVREQG